ncbi:tetratricopeptide repeat protein [Aeoliella sp. ICT_H6.2]|uniref:Tetratricopeptide repeat protein n=2 Tax=Aeoliella straminimaris TaxID=2954799 RepID=A0A9X2JHK6_9BACT|nr:tetratricopeptide repeat protein [Aeoliella straminimaris]
MMTDPIRHATACLFLVLSLVATSNSALSQSTDRIRTIGGSESGEVIRMSPVSVVIQKGSETKEIPVNEIRSIIFRQEPSELTQARLNAVNAGYESALSRLSAINTSALTNDFIKQDVEYYTAYCNAKMALLGSKNIRAAGMELNSFVGKYDQSYHFLEATELLGDLLATMGNYSAAEAMYNKLAKAPWPEYRMRSAVLVGQTMLAQGKNQQALGQFDAALKVNDDSPGGKQQRLAAELGKAVASAATGNVDEGLKAVEQVIRDADPENDQLLAKAYNALGACYVQSGQPKLALYAYLHTDLLYGRVAEEHAEALAKLIPLWESVGQDGEARRARETLVTQYPASRWAKQLQ